MFPRKHFFKPFPFASDDLGFKLLNVGIPVILSILTMFAGVALMMAEHLIVKFDKDPIEAFELVSKLGLTTLAIIWLVNMLGLAFCLGHEPSATKASLLILLFVISACYLLFTLHASCYMIIPRGITNLT